MLDAAAPNPFDRSTVPYSEWKLLRHPIRCGAVHVNLTRQGRYEWKAVKWKRWRRFSGTQAESRARQRFVVAAAFIRIGQNRTSTIILMGLQDRNDQTMCKPDKSSMSFSFSGRLKSTWTNIGLLLDWTGKQGWRNIWTTSSKTSKYLVSAFNL